MSESVLQSQHEVITRNPKGEETGNEHDKLSVLDDIGYNADLYIFNQVLVQVQDQSFILTFGWLARDFFIIYRCVALGMFLLLDQINIISYL